MTSEAQPDAGDLANGCNVSEPPALLRPERIRASRALASNCRRN